jgi:hypothetical protein
MGRSVVQATNVDLNLEGNENINTCLFIQSFNGDVLYLFIYLFIYNPCPCNTVYFAQQIFLKYWRWIVPSFFAHVAVLGAFAKLRKATVSFVISVCPHGITRLPLDGFLWNLIYLSISRKSVEKIQLPIKSDKNNRYSKRRPMYIYDNISLHSSYNDKCLDKFVEKIKTHILCSIPFFRKSCRLWDNVEKYGTAGQASDDNIIRRMRCACWITKSTDRHSEYVTLIAFPWQQWFRERASILRLHI